MSGPTIDRANSSGDIWTPQPFREALMRRFGLIAVDLAASAQNSLAPLWIDEARDSLTQGWWMLKGLLYLNPPFSNVTPWARKCAEEAAKGAEILLLVPGSVGANWYWNWVEPFAQVYSVGRMVFDNCFDRKTGELVTTVYAKDLILCHYKKLQHQPVDWPLRMERWRWQDE